MDPDNPVVKLCVKGMQAEAGDRSDEASIFFMQAWEASKDDYDACIAAHFMARHQVSPQDMQHWNEVALIRANAVGDERVRTFYPSLYLNMGYSYELLGNWTEARRYYQLAAGKVDDLPDGSYSEVVRNGIANGRKRVGLTE